MNILKRVSAALLAVMLITTIGCAGSATNESAGEYIDDTLITAKVKTALLSDSEVKATEVNVETFKGVVQLSGFVESTAAMNRAVDIADDIAGVTSVKNDMQIK